jgi:peptide/nickel transport system permease protein
MVARLLRKLAWAAFVVWAVVSLTFVFNSVLPSDPARMVAGPQARPADVERIRTQLGLGRPVVVQYFAFLRRLVHVRLDRSSESDPEHTTCEAFGPIHVDLGKSYQQRRAVTQILAERLPRTASLAIVAVLLQSLLGVAAGVLGARFHRRVIDRLVVGTTLLGTSVPTFMLGLALQYVLARKWRLLPTDGFGHTLGEHMQGIVLPALTLGFYGAAYYARIVRDDVVDILREDYVRTARAKGGSEPRVLLRHALRNALLPVVTMMGLDLGALVSGAVVTETLFRWPGIGALSVTAVLDRDGPVIVGTVLVASVAVVLANLVVDLLYAVLDPRARPQSG